MAVNISPRTVMFNGFGKSLSSAFACAQAKSCPLTISFDSER